MKKLLQLIIAFGIGTGFAFSQNKEEKKVADAVEKFRKTMVDPYQKTFEALTSEHLSYGHSSGLIEDRKIAIESMVSGKFNFTSLDLTEQTVQVVGKTAWVRHTFFAHTHDAGKEAGTVKLKVLMIWVKQKGDWILLARQAVKVL